jgi:peptide/nickel transport system permease protein
MPAIRRFLRNRPAVAGLLFLLLIHLAAAVGPLLSAYSPEATDPARVLDGSSAAHWLGTDELGRDLLVRLLHGGRVSLIVGLISVILGVFVGAVLGAISGYFGGLIDALIMRITDAMMALPSTFIIMVAVAVYGGGTSVLVIVIGLTSWMGVARLVRGEYLRWKSLDFVHAARALGATDQRIIVRHILPQTLSALVVSATLGVANGILAESVLSYLGLGVQPPLPSWGNMLTNAQNYIWGTPLPAVYPGLLILLTVLSYNFFGDGLRDALDPSQLTR